MLPLLTSGAAVPRLSIAAAACGDLRLASCAMNVSTSPSWPAVSCRARRSVLAVESKLSFLRGRSANADTHG